MRKKVIIDTDPGIDDSIALLLALNSPKLEVLGITTTVGNIGIDLTTQNALKLVDFCSKNIPVYKGAEAPLKKQVEISDDCHGKDGMGNINLPDSNRQPETQSAPDFLIEIGKRYHEEVSIISLGPMTNLATAIQKDPGAMSNFKEIISMGGGVGIGNMSPVAEFNYWVDPEAAKVVYDFTIPVTMIGLNVTTQVVFTPTDFDFIKKLGGEMSELIYNMQTHYINYYWETERVLGSIAHDVLAVAVACDPKLVETVHCNVDIATDGITRGECVADLIGVWGQKKNCHVALQVDEEGFKDMFFEKLFPENAQEYEYYKEFLTQLK